MKKVIELKDGLSVEVEVDDNQIHEVSDRGSVDSSLSKIKDFMGIVTKPLVSTFEELNKEVSIQKAKVSLGIKFGIEGGFILAKGNTDTNIAIEFIVRPKND